MSFTIGRFLQKTNSDEPGLIITFYNPETHRRAELEILDDGWIWLTMYATNEAPKNMEVIVLSNLSEEGSIPVLPSEMFNRIEEYLK